MKIKLLLSILLFSAFAIAMEKEERILQTIEKNPRAILSEEAKRLSDRIRYLQVPCVLFTEQEQQQVMYMRGLLTQIKTNPVVPDSLAKQIFNEPLILETILYLISCTEKPSTFVNIAYQLWFEAAANNQLSALRILANWGIDVNRREDLGATAIHIAATHGHAQAVSLLLHLGANPSIPHRINASLPFGSTQDRDTLDILTRYFVVHGYKSAN